MTSPQQQRTFDQASDDELIDSLVLSAQQANQAGIAPQILQALNGARNGNLATVEHAAEIQKRLAAYAERVVQLEDAIASLKATQGAAEDRAAVEAVVKDIASNGTHKRVTAV